MQSDFVMTISDSEDIPPWPKRKRDSEGQSEREKRARLSRGEDDEHALDPDFVFEWEHGPVTVLGDSNLGVPQKKLKGIDLASLVARKLERNGNHTSDEDLEEADNVLESQAGSELSGEEEESNYAADAVDVGADPGDSSSDDDAERLDQEQDERAVDFFAPEDEAPASVGTFDRTLFRDLHISRPVLKGITATGFSNPTPIQKRAIPVALEGKDVVGGAITGSGKTAAFLIPILERLLYRPKKIPTSRVAILMPTRELALQCHNVAVKLARYTDITFCCLIGGSGSTREQENKLKLRPDVIVATPGRFIDLMRNSPSFTIDTIEILVLDEADRMLEDGFADELNEILTTLPKARQTMLFSATMTDSIDKLIRVGLNRPVRLLVDAKQQTVNTLIQEIVRLREGREDKRLAYLVELCKSVYTRRVIIFFRQKQDVHRTRVVFLMLGLKATELHGNLTQEQRSRNVEEFRNGEAHFLLATDIASRGLDIRGVESVINFEAPQSLDTYLHRVGRTARAGRAGHACTITSEKDRKVVKAAVKNGKKQGTIFKVRPIDVETTNSWANKLEAMEADITAILQEEKEEKQLNKAQMQLTKGSNIIEHQDEIMSRPKRTWFQSEADKKASKDVGKTELNSKGARPKEKRKSSNKDKKKLADKDTRSEGRLWKKPRDVRLGGLKGHGHSKTAGVKGKKGARKGKA